MISSETEIYDSVAWASREQDSDTGGPFQAYVPLGKEAGFLCIYQWGMALKQIHVHMDLSPRTTLAHSLKSPTVISSLTVSDCTPLSLEADRGNGWNLTLMQIVEVL